MVLICANLNCYPEFLPCKGNRLQIGAAVLQITAEPHQGCSKFKQRFGADALAFVNSTLGDKHRLRGVYAKIISAGEVCVDDTISKL